MDCNLSDLKILYVEDESVTRMAVTRVLQKRVSEVITAKNGKEGFELFQEHCPDIVLTDLQMPVMDGWELVLAIRKINKEVPIIVISAYDYDNSNSLVSDSIVKPVLKDVLFDKIKFHTKN